MGSRLLWGLATATILLQICSVCWCKVTVSVKFISYRNSHARDHEGKHCDPRLIVPNSPCDHFFEICIDKITRHSPGAHDWVSNCEYAYAKTGWYHDLNEITFDHDMRTVANPINVDLPDKEEGVAVRVLVRDHDSGLLRGEPDIVDHLEFDYFIEEDNGLFRSRDSAESYRRLITGRRTTTVPSSLTIDFSAYCAENFYKYQGLCTKYCKESRSKHFGQYSCTEDGDKRCFKGWKGEDTNCTTEEDQFNFLEAVPQQGGGGETSNTTLIIGLVLGIFALILLVVIVIALLLRERRKRKQLKEQGTSTTISTTTMGQQTHPVTSDMGTGGSYANPAFSSDTSAQTDNLRNQRGAQGTQTATGHGVKAMEAGLLSPPPYKVADIPTGGSARFQNLTYGEQHVGAVGGASEGGRVENLYDEVELNKKY